MACDIWYMLIFTVLFLVLFPKTIKKNNYQKPLSKHHVVWTAPSWITVDSFTASHGKMWTDSPPIFWNDLWHVVNVDLHRFVAWSFSRTTNKKPITKNQHQKQHVVWTAPFWVIVIVDTLQHPMGNSPWGSLSKGNVVMCFFLHIFVS